MPSGDVLELNDVSLGLGLKKNLLSVSCIIDVEWGFAFEKPQCTISDCSLASPRTLARRVKEGRLFRLLVDPMALVHSSERMEEPSSFEEALE
jgi:hypothetical protein